MDLYASKGAINARLLPLVDRLAAAGITADQVTLAACRSVSSAAACCSLPGRSPLLLLPVPLLASLGLCSTCSTARWLGGPA